MRARTVMVPLSAVLIAAWAMRGLAQMPHWPDDGYSADARGRVLRVDPGGPAEAGGLLTGDEILSIDGVPVADLPAPPRRTLPRIGESQTLALRRDGVAAVVDLDLAPHPDRLRLTRVLGGIVALSFLGAAVWVSLTVASSAGLVFSAFGLPQGLSLVEGPFLGSLEGFAGLAEIMAGVASLSLVVHLFLLIPNPRRILDRPHLHKALYGPLLILLVLGVAEVLLDPRFYVAFGAATLGWMSAYLVVLLWTFGKGWATARPEARRESGMGIILAGLGIALAPRVLRLLLSLALPHLVLPGAEYFTLLAAAIPFSMALAIRKHQRWVLESQPSVAG